ncbi:MAG: hypothetical protein KME35_15985 [Aphanocapsa sp. GSE-SYN-MK-11-07L]|jgi:hypothetical protein|nr:hypothetical protein [Aphanocapsa sp. GSE-SYN-MK-11-07L]
MNLLSSFTRSFKSFNAPKLNFRSRQHEPIRRAILTGVWTLFFLLLLDFSINSLFSYPTDASAHPRSQLQVYFEYGRSIEGKLSRLLGPTNQQSAAIAQSGWLDQKRWQQASLPTRPEPGDNLLMAVYGMSFSEHVAKEVEALDPTITIRAIGAPSAPPNHSYTAYLLDRNVHQADIVVLGILASSVKGLRTLNGMTWQFESPAPYSYPRYRLEAGKLKATVPKVDTLAELRTAFDDPTLWNDYIQQLQADDQFYDWFLFRHNFFDRSAIARMMRRGFAQRHQEKLENEVYTKTKGFNSEVDIPVLQAIATEFAARVRADGKLPVLLLINDSGYADHLYQALKPTLESNSIQFVSTHTIAPVTDATNFISDGHFTKTANRRIGQAMLSLINQHYDR